MQNVAFTISICLAEFMILGHYTAHKQIHLYANLFIDNITCTLCLQKNILLSLHSVHNNAVYLRKALCIAEREEILRTFVWMYPADTLYISLMLCSIACKAVCKLPFFCGFFFHKSFLLTLFYTVQHNHTFLYYICILNI